MEKNNPKSKWRLSIFDIVIITLVIVAGIAVLFFNTDIFGNKDGGEDTKVKYTIELTNLLENSTQMIKVDDEVMDASKKFRLGTIVDVQISDTLVTVKDLTTGNYVQKVLPNNKTALVTIEAPATETDSTITVDNGYVLRGGNGITIVGPGYTGGGFVLYIERSDDAE